MTSTARKGRPKLDELNASRADRAAELAAKEKAGQAGRALRSKMKNV